MTNLLRGVRPLDYVAAAALTALGVYLMVINMQGPDGSTRIVEVQQGTPRHVKGIVHAEQNIGTTEAHAVLIEIKNAAQ